MSRIVDVLGTTYKIVVKKYMEDESFERSDIDGYCDICKKEIVVCDMTTYKGWEHEDSETCNIIQKEVLRHEIVHAFLNESGLSDNSVVFNRGWAKNEEMIDWIALQGAKIYNAWREAEAL